MTKISWTHMPPYKGETWDIVEGCTKKSAGCAKCWALRQINRMAGSPALKDIYGGLVERQNNGLLNWTGEVRQLWSRLDQPIHWRVPRMVFVCSRADFFHESVGDAFRTMAFNAMASTPQHLYLILTKRVEQMADMLAVVRRVSTTLKNHPWPLPNVWLGTSVEDQDTADRRIPALLNAPAARHFVSYEPALGSIVWQRPWTGAPGLDWIIYGGESDPGGHARPSESAWAEAAWDFCREHEIAFYYKQGSGLRAEADPYLTCADGTRWSIRQWPGMLTPPEQVGESEVKDL